MDYRFECVLRIFRQVVALSVAWELVRDNISLERQHGLRDQRGGVSVAAYEFCRMPEREVDQVVEDQHLSIAIWPGANADRRRFDFSRDHGGNFARNPFEIDAGHASAIKRDRIAHELLDGVQRFALNFVPSHDVDRLRSEADMPGDGMDY